MAVPFHSSRYDICHVTTSKSNYLNSITAAQLPWIIFYFLNRQKFIGTPIKQEISLDHHAQVLLMTEQRVVHTLLIPVCIRSDLSSYWAQLLIQWSEIWIQTTWYIIPADAPWCHEVLVVVVTLKCIKWDAPPLNGCTWYHAGVTTRACNCQLECVLVNASLIEVMWRSVSRDAYRDLWWMGAITCITTRVWLKNSRSGVSAM